MYSQHIYIWEQLYSEKICTIVHSTQYNGTHSSPIRYMIEYVTMAEYSFYKY